MEQKIMKKKWLQLEDILIAYQHLKDIVTHTPLQKNERLSEKYNCNVYLKREDLQVVRSFKLRGAYYLYENASSGKAVRMGLFVQVRGIMLKVLRMPVKHYR